MITDPSSRFDADGDGIINLVMKKGKKVGLSGNVSTTAGTQGNYRAGAFLSSRKKETSHLMPMQAIIMIFVNQMLPLRGVIF